MNEILKQASLKQALKARELPHLPGYLMHLTNFPYYLSMSKVEKDMVTWHPELKHLIQDRQMRTTLGKVLRATTQLKDHEIRDLVKAHTDWVNRKYPKFTLKWANTPDEAQAVYENRAKGACKNAFGEDKYTDEPLCDTCAEDSSNASCMGHHEADYAGNFHPARIYGNKGQIEVGYIADHEGIVARAVCSMEPKTYVRVYQRYKTQGGSILRGLLAEAGFKQARYLQGKVLAYEYDDTTPHMPYLDWETLYDWRPGDSWIYLSSSGQYCANNTNGLGSNVEEEDEDSCCCDTCGCTMDQDESTYVDDQTLCQSCLESEYEHAYTGGCREWVRRDECMVCEDNGEYYSDRGVEYHNLVTDNNGQLRELDCVEWVESIGEYVDVVQTFTDIEGEIRHTSEIELGWYVRLSGFGLAEDDPESEDWMQLGTWLFAHLWSFKPRFWNAEMSSLLPDRVRREVVGKFSWYVTCDLSLWEFKAQRFGVTFDANDKPVIGE